MNFQDQRHAIRHIVAAIIGHTNALPDEYELADEFDSKGRRQRIADEINSKAADIAAALGYEDFAGTVTESELRSVANAKQLLDLLLRHANRELDNDIWSAF